MANDVRVTMQTGTGTISFPHLTLAAAQNNTNDKGVPQYDAQLIIPKTEKAALRAILAAIQEVGQAKWGENWKKVRKPLRDGDKEAGDLVEDGSMTKGEKYPERLGCYFINARSAKPVAVVGRDRTPLADPDNEVYGGCKARLNVTFYPYANNGNLGVAAALNGVQKIADGEPFGAGAQSVESMFDLLDDDDDLGLDDEVETPTPAKKAPAKKAPAKEAAAKPVEDLEVADEADDEDDLFGDLDDLD